MLVPSDRDLLSLWESGLNRHPIDRALLLGAWARPDLPPEQLAELPIGALNAALLRLRETWFGPRLEAVVDCERCGVPVELDLSIAELLTAAVEGEERELCDLGDYRFRAPNSRDLAALISVTDAEAGPLLLLERCCVGRPDDEGAALADLTSEVEVALERIDPAADFELTLECDQCSHRWADSLPVGGLFWHELESLVRALFEQIHTLAAVYGWTESEILSLSPPRRAVYVEMATG